MIIFASFWESELIGFSLILIKCKINSVDEKNNENIIIVTQNNSFRKHERVVGKSRGC